MKITSKTPEGYSRKIWPKGHPACDHLQNKEGQAWRPGKVELEGEDIFGNKKKFMVDKGQYKCKKCDAIVRFDIRGYAHCTICGEIHNDGIREIPRISNRVKKDMYHKRRVDCLRKD